MTNVERDFPRPPTRPGEPGLAVDVRNLRCNYGSFEAVRGIDLRADEGELLAVLGTNGAGKTTALDALQGRRPADGGAIRIFGLDPHEQRRRLAARAGVMLQDHALPTELTPVEVLRLWSKLDGGAGHHRPIDDSLAQVGLTHRRDVRIGRLSGGERRRLDLAVALSSDPELLFLDEPTAGLDPESRLDAWDLLRDVRRRGCTAVLTTHYLEEAEALADRLVILHEGRAVVSGPRDEILAARDARIRCQLPRDVIPPRDDLTGEMTSTPDRSHQRLEIRTPELEADLRRLLMWAHDRGTPLSRLHASEPTLAEIFHDIRQTTTAEEAAQ